MVYGTGGRFGDELMQTHGFNKVVCHMQVDDFGIGPKRVRISGRWRQSTWLLADIQTRIEVEWRWESAYMARAVDGVGKSRSRPKVKYFKVLSPK